MSYLESWKYEKHVHKLTQIHGHILDMVITTEDSDIVSDISVSDSCLCDEASNLSTDLFAIIFTLPLLKLTPVQKIIDVLWPLLCTW